jgi:hypothetical protein
MLGSGNPTPYDVPLAVVLALIALLLLAGAMTASSWSPSVAAMVRRASLAVAIAAFAVVMVVTPTTNGMIGAWRVLFVWPPLGLAVIGYLVWSWRVGSL